MSSKSDCSQNWAFGPFELEGRTTELRRNGLAVRLQEQPSRLLLFLLQHAGQIVTREDLRLQLWPADTFVDFDHSLNTAVMKLREALGDSSEKPFYIQTLPRKGYRFVAPAATVPSTYGRSTLAAASALSLLRSAEPDERIASLGIDFLDSIAVLPFQSAGGQSDIEYLSEGITSSLINSLSQLNRLRVVPRTTVFRYKGAKSDPAQIGRELQVRVALVGWVSQRGERLVINLELIDAIRESQLWGTSYDRRLEDILSVQSEVAADVSARLRLRLDDGEKKQLARRPTENLEAYHLYLRAIHWANKWTAEGLRKGIDYTRQALDLDPAYADAWTGLSHVYMLTGMGGASPNDAFPRAKAAAAKALEIDDHQADAHAVLAFVRLYYEWDWQGSHKEVLRAIELAPHLAEVHNAYSLWYLTQGLYEEAAVEARIALDIDPLSVRYSCLAGFISFCAGQYDLAIEQLYKSIELDPLFGPTYQFLAQSYARKKMRNEAVAVLERVPEDDCRAGFRNGAFQAIVDAQTGKHADARIVLDKLRQELRPPDFKTAYHCAVLHALLGEKDEAFRCLEMARRGHSFMLIYLAIAINLESLRDDPRFLDLLRRIGIPVSETLESSYRKARAGS
jgi:TolB-like protein/Tfp pilus assembly protein PilF